MCIRDRVWVVDSGPKNTSLDLLIQNNIGFASIDVINRRVKLLLDVETNFILLYFSTGHLEFQNVDVSSFHDQLNYQRGHEDQDIHYWYF